MSNMFEIVESLPAGRANRHSEILDEFMKLNTRYVKLTDVENVRTNTLTLIAKQRQLGVKVHKDKDTGDIYLENTEL